MVSFKTWNRWRKLNLNNPIHKILVLLGVVRSPTYEEMAVMDAVRAALLEITKGA